MEAELGDELVALDAEAGSCFGFNPVATSVWRLLATPRSFEQIETALLDEYDVEASHCRSELGDLIADMLSRGLIVEDTNAEQSSSR